MSALRRWASSSIEVLQSTLTWLTARKQPVASYGDDDAETSDPGLLRKHTTYESYTTSIATYPRIRTFYSPHPQAAKLPTDLPLLVFIHGLGGSVAQFAPLLTSLVNTAPCLAIDLPGCGLSDFKPDEASAYTTAAFAELVAAAVKKRLVDGQQVVFVGHSMGCSITALLVSSASKLALDPELIGGLIAIAPRSTPPTPGQMQLVKRLRWLPVVVFDLFRLVDNIGGLNSASVTRFVGAGADVETRKLQSRYNQQSQSKVVLRYITALALGTGGGDPSFPGEEVWSHVRAPLFLIAAECDTVNTPGEASAIVEWLTHTDRKASESAPVDESTPLLQNGGPVPAAVGDVQLATEQLTTPHSNGIRRPSGLKDQIIDKLDSKSHTSTHHYALKSTVFPAPASHGVLYATSTVRILSGLMQSFLSAHVDKRLDLGWQLQHLTTSGKWDVKNLAKWQKIAPCSEPIAGIFRATKTMREVDETHNPKAFAARHSSKVLPDGVAIVVDISHESPVYDPKGLEAAGIEYYKFPTVSKLPPTADEVTSFINLIDHLRESPRLQPAGAGHGAQPVIGVHCHYGFNRTGFFIVCYLVERCGYRLQDAVEEFGQKRSPGIKHEHFVNELFVRYAVSLERRGTIIR
ncbi:hypothetical protein B0A48_01172 [Cryoendolithus antarcticus]|uniref:Tyrosine specific protein phosphatases domain-containing protein n=1 Tax=Cryoendolithus antarcticus TaxID=1507870 RepID=A0A1V8TSF5_9PEZI|nr:hypothetical protein B0A48_01172 [Cryoendolithus antarcticus]